MTPTKFTDEELAKEDLKARLRSEDRKKSHIFCPLSRQACNIHCACWVRARITQQVYSTSSAWTVFSGHCDCSALHGGN